nr:hypothetical protein BaRGS_013531 [Batillaria attramentaria]
MAAAMHEDDEAEFAQSVRDGKWYEVAEFLKKGVRPVLQTWAVHDQIERSFHWALEKKKWERKEFERFAEDVATVLQRVGEENQIDFGIKAECLNTALKSAAVRHLVIYCRMHTDGWKVFDVICSLSGVWEEVRRWALKEAIDKKQWQAVKGFIDTNLYDDQRESALRAALREKQMDVVAALAEFGLTDDVLMLVHSQVALHADWDTFLQLCERGVSVRFVRQDLESASVRREGHPSKEATDRYNRRLDQVRNLERQVSKDARSFSVAVAKNNWPAIFLHLQNDTNREKVDIALKAALENHAYHVVVHLVKHAMDVTQRNSLFPEAIRRRLWGVGRALLERDVNVELCQAALPELLKHSQWVLVARIVEHADIDDSERRKVIDVAMASREESLVLHCISTLTVEMSVMDRDTLFEKALAEDLWRVVMRLVEEKDAVGISQRDTALLTAVERNRWDEADHCQRHGADIDMKDRSSSSRDIIYCYRTWCYYRAVELVVTSGKLTVAKPSAETLLKHAYLKKIATNPRRLESKCRLMISHIVGVWKKRERERRVMQLPILSDEMKDFVLFSDLLDPDLENSERYKSLMEELRKDAGI